MQARFNDGGQGLFAWLPEPSEQKVDSGRIGVAAQQLCQKHVSPWPPKEN